MTTITEAGSLTPTGDGGTLRVRVIDAGRGSSGIYPADTLAEAAKSRVFARGTLMYADHPGVEESYDRPERSIKDLAGVLATDAVYDPTTKALEADVQVFSHWAPIIREMGPHIGVSIRASAEVDESSGVPTIRRITRAESVDFVTTAGRGGKVLSLGEAAAPSNEAILTEAARYLTETTPAPAGAHQESPPQGAVPKEEPVSETPTQTPAPIAEANTAQAVSEAARIAELEAAVQESRNTIEAGKAQVRKANQTAAELIVAEAFDGIEAPKARARLIDAAVAEAGHEAIDAEALRESAKAEAAEFHAANGAGRPTGLGGTAHLAESGADISDKDILTALTGGN